MRQFLSVEPMSPPQDINEVGETDLPGGMPEKVDRIKIVEYPTIKRTRERTEELIYEHHILLRTLNLLWSEGLFIGVSH